MRLASAIDAPARFLPMARALLVDQGEDALLVEVTPDAVEPIETLFAYPYGRLKDPGSLPSKKLAGQGPLLRRRWRIAIAVESAGLMLSGLDTVVEHVKSRMAFGRPLGSFQAIQHRLVMAAEQAQATLWLSRQAAWRDSDSDAAADDFYVGLTRAGIDVLYDDRDQPAGAKFATADLIGIPYQLIVGPRGLKAGEVEIKHRKTGDRETLPLGAAIDRLKSLIEPQRRDRI